MKDAQWVNDRQHLEEIQRQLGVNEVIMHDDSGSISEGLQTNFFAEIDGVLLTAPDDCVLSGTVRKVVLEVSKANGIPVKLECPNMGDINRWGSCFIFSTSRLDAGLIFLQSLYVVCDACIVQNFCQHIRITYPSTILYHFLKSPVPDFDFFFAKVKPIHALTSPNFGERRFEKGAGLAHRLEETWCDMGSIWFHGVTGSLFLCRLHTSSTLHWTMLDSMPL